MRETLRAALMMIRQRTFLILWLMLVFGILAWTLAAYEAQPDPELKIEILARHGLIMLGLTVPIGWIITVATSAIVYLAGWAATGVSDALLVSLSCAVAGYLQWFVLLPWLWSRWKARTFLKSTKK